MESVIVHTTKDIEKDTAFPRRRKNTSKACSSCRKLKIRCRELFRGTGTSSCLHCHKVGLACSWPQADARKHNRAKPKPRQPLSTATPPFYPSDTELAAMTGLSDVPEDCVKSRFPYPQDQAHGCSGGASTATQETDNLGTPYSVLQYYRYLGSTAIAPGYKKVSLKIAGDDSSEPNGAPPESLEHFDMPVIDPCTNLPLSELIPHLLDAFFEYYGSNFCFLNRAQLEGLISKNEISSFLLCSIAALSSRFCSREVFAPFFAQASDGRERDYWQHSLPFLNQAKKLLMPLISIPSCDLVAGLLFLALAEFGDNNEAGMWMFTGMAVRVAQELGLHRQRPSIYTSIGRSPTNDAADAASHAPRSAPSLKCQEFEISSQIVLFWCVFVQDTCLANGTGRVPSVKLNEVSIRLPTDDDVASVKAGPNGLTYRTESDVFPYMVRMMLEFARSIEFLNAEYQPGNRIQSGGRGLNNITTIREGILSTYDAMPHKLGLGAAQYRNASGSGQAIPYLVMHLNHHLQIAFLAQARRAIEYESPESDHYDLNGKGSPIEGQTHSTHEHRAYEDQLYRKAIKSIVDVLTIARFVDDRPLLSTFFLNQSFFHAACAYAGDMLRLRHRSSYHLSRWDNESAFPLPSHAMNSVVCDLDDLWATTNNSASLTSAGNYLGLLAKTNYQVLRQAIRGMAKYYAGAVWVDAVLAQRESGIRDVDLSIVNESISTYIRLHDLRATQRTSNQALQSSQPIENTAQSGGNLMFSQDILSSIPLDFDSQAFFNDYISTEVNVSPHPSHEPG